MIIPFVNDCPEVVGEDTDDGEKLSNHDIYPHIANVGVLTGIIPTKKAAQIHLGGFGRFNYLKLIQLLLLLQLF